MFVLLAPLLLFNGQPVSPMSPLVNLLAIPLIGIGVVPL
ncbi:ComEC/Rec2 family competence protein [Endozoicomonas sp.]